MTKPLSEHHEQAYVIKWAASMEWKWPELKYLHASQSGMRTSIGTAMKAKAAGLKRGCPDLFLPVRNCYSSGLFLELKRADIKPKRNGKGGVSDEQFDWHRFLREQGFMVVIAYGAEEAIRMIQNYLMADR